jgi:hypothetical protein
MAERIPLAERIIAVLAAITAQIIRERPTIETSLYRVHFKHRHSSSWIIG